MKIRAFLGTAGLSVSLMTSLAFPAVARAQTPGQIVRRPAFTEIKPSLSADKQTINVVVRYRAEELSWLTRGHRTVIYPKKISAAEVYINGTERKTQLFTPSAQGERRFAIAVNSLSASERTGTLNFQSKISTHFVYAPQHIDSSSWNKRTASSKVVPFILP